HRAEQAVRRERGDPRRHRHVAAGQLGVGLRERVDQLVEIEAGFDVSAGQNEHAAKLQEAIAAAASSRRGRLPQGGSTWRRRSPSARWTRPPIHPVAAHRWSQSATVSARLTDEWPDSDNPDASVSPITKAGQSRTRRSVSHARKTRAVTTAKPSSIAMNA